MSKRQNSRTASIEAAPEAVATIAETANPPRELTELQKFVVDLFADMMLRGGNLVVFGELISALAAHHYNQKHNWEYATDTPREFDSHDDYIKKYAKEKADDWCYQLRQQWPILGTAFSVPESNSITERVRAHKRQALRELFNEFCVGATPEEILILTDILQFRESSSLGADYQLKFEELPLADSFAFALADNKSYFKVAEKHRGLVKKYIDLLHKAGGASNDEDE